MAGPAQATNNGGPNLEALGLKSPMEVIDILAMLNIEGEPVIKDDRVLLDPQLKVQEVMSFFKEKGIAPAELPYIASTIKQQIKAGSLT